MQHFIKNGEYTVDIDYSAEVNLKTFKEEVLEYVYHLYREHGGMSLLYSGGNDSTFLMRTFLELGIQPDLLTMVFSRSIDTTLRKKIDNICSFYSLKTPEYFYVDHDKVLEHSVNLIENEKKAYPMPHGFFIDYCLSSFSNQKFISGMGSEFKTEKNKIKLPAGPWLVKVNNPGRLFDFTTSRTFLSYVNHDIFKTEYLKQPVLLPYSNIRKDVWYIRDLIYNHAYSDLKLPSKSTDGEADYNLGKLSDTILNLTIEKIPDMHWKNIKPFYFDVDEYFKRKKENNAS